MEGKNTSQGMRPSSIRQVNRKAILKHLLDNGECSVEQIRSALGLSRTSVVKALNEFLLRGLVTEAGKGTSLPEGGKRPELFRLDDEALYSISVRINRSDAVIEQRTLSARPLRSLTIELNAPDDYAQTVQCIADALSTLIRYYALDTQRMVGVVIGSDGVLDMETGSILIPAHHAWEGKMNICRDLRQATGLAEVPFYLGNMVVFAGYEQLHQQNVRRIALLLLAGVSGSCVVDADFPPTSDAFSELIHMIVQPDAQEICPICGQRGCFHAMVSTRRLRRLYEERSGTSIGRPESVFALADAGDAIAQTLLDETARCFAVMLHNLSVAVHPQCIHIGDRYRDPGIYMKEKLESIARGLSDGRFGREVRLSFGGGFEDFAPGAAWFATLRFLNSDEKEV